MTKEEIKREIIRLGLDIEECQEALYIVQKDELKLKWKKADLEEALAKIENEEEENGKK